MKKFWKALGIAALAAAVPVRFKKDEETGKKTYQSLLISVDVGPGENGEGTAIGINIGDGVISRAVLGAVNAKKETVHFADDDPESAVVPDVIDFAEAAKAQEAVEAPKPAPAEGPAEPEVTEEDFDPEM